MAKTKEEKAAIAEKAVLTAEENITEVKEEKISKETKTGPSYDELMDIVKVLAAKVESLESNKPQSSNDMSEILNLLSNRKSDREVAIVHNCQLNGGLTTHIQLSNVSIDFTRIGETRLLSWQQFEECASKYRSFFENNIILIGADNVDVAKQYGLPCVAESEYHVLTQEDITKLPTLTVPQLEKFIESLSDQDKDTVFSYWLGKCYAREEKFYDRHKMDTLNRLSNGAFETIILVKNGDERNAADEAAKSKK